MSHRNIRVFCTCLLKPNETCLKMIGRCRYILRTFSTCQEGVRMALRATVRRTVEKTVVCSLISSCMRLTSRLQLLLPCRHPALRCLVLPPFGTRPHDSVRIQSSFLAEPILLLALFLVRPVLATVDYFPQSPFSGGLAM
jgi:hypothetical protein